MNAGRLLLQTRAESATTISARRQLLQSFRDPEYRRLFVKERLHASVALQIRALRQQHEMTQAELGEAIGMAQTWISKLEDPDYGKMTVATLLRLAGAFDADLEIKFRPFSKTLDSLPTQGPEYFHVPTFEEEFGQAEAPAREGAEQSVSIRSVGPTTVGTLETLMGTASETTVPYALRKQIHVYDALHNYQGGPYGRLLESEVLLTSPITMVGNRVSITPNPPSGVLATASIRKPPMQEVGQNLKQISVQIVPSGRITSQNQQLAIGV